MGVELGARTVLDGAMGVEGKLVWGAAAGAVLVDIMLFMLCLACPAFGPMFTKLSRLSMPAQVELLEILFAIFPLAAGLPAARVLFEAELVIGPVERLPKRSFKLLLCIGVLLVELAGRLGPEPKRSFMELLFWLAAGVAAVVAVAVAVEEPKKSLKGSLFVVVELFG